jgi:endonuclease G
MNDALPQETITEVADAALVTVGYDAATRRALLRGLPPLFAGMMPDGGPPRVAMLNDLAFLNGRRLTGGLVPLKTWLANAANLAGSMDEASPIRDALAELEARTSGARVAVATGTVEKSRLADSDGTVRNERLTVGNDMLPLGFLEAGLIAARSVAKLTVPRYDGGIPRTAMDGTPVSYLGTGWLVGPGLLMTNHHVVNARNDGEPSAGEADLRAQVAAMTVLFDYDGAAASGTSVAPVELIGWDATLDYAVVRIAESARAPLTLAKPGITSVQADVAIAVNVIQHPNGTPKKLGIRNNLVSAATATALTYFTGTLEGSSGSPVLNDRWQVVALHRGSTTAKQGATFQGVTMPYVNIGTQLYAIAADFGQRYPGIVPSFA